MLIGFQNKASAMQDYFGHYFKHQKVGLVTCITGSRFLKTGTGKSYSALRIGELNDPDFSIDKVAYYPRDFLRVMDDIENHGKPGQVAVVDEGEITAPAALWYSFTNKAIGYNLATNRYLRCMSIFVTPAFSWMDKRVRLLTNHLGFCEKYYKDYDNPNANKIAVKMRFYRVETDDFGDRIRLRKIRMFDVPNRQIVAFKTFDVGLPSPALCEAYEKKSREFKRTLRQGLMVEAAKFEAYQNKKALDEEKKPVNLRELAVEALKNPVINGELLQRGKVSTATLANEFEDKKLTQFEYQRAAKIVGQLFSGKG